MANPVVTLNSNFMFNSSLARSLLILYPPEERMLGRAWLRYLSAIPSSSADDLTKRTQYIWYLLLVLQRGGELTAPFRDLPPCDDNLPDLQTFISADVYEELLNAAGKENWDSEESEEEKAWHPPPIPPPPLFLKYQPIPSEGTICYMAAFSDPKF